MRLAGIVPLLLLSGCHAIPHQPPHHPTVKTADVQIAVAGDREFTSRLYAQLAGTSTNVFFSPASVRMALTMTWVGARGDTATEIQHAIAFDADPLLVSYAWRGLRALWADSAKKNPSLSLHIASGFFSTLHQQFSPGFLELCASRYDAPLARLDFRGAAEASRLEINRWVEKHTDGKIEDLLDSGAIDPNTRLILVNAMYFQAAWEKPFDPTLTHTGDFVRSDQKKIKAPMMSRLGPESYGESADARVLELPYEGGDFVMDVLLPTGDISVLEAALQDPKKIDELTGALAEKEIEVLLPRFQLKSRYDLVAPLKKLGMQVAFERGKADFSGMDGERDLFIDDVIHQATINVNERSTEATAGSAAAAAQSAAPPGVTQFHADHPFLFLIRDKQRNAILFFGRVSDPTA